MWHFRHLEAKWLINEMTDYDRRVHGQEITPTNPLLLFVVCNLGNMASFCSPPVSLITGFLWWCFNLFRRWAGPSNQSCCTGFILPLHCSPTFRQTATLKYLDQPTAGSHNRSSRSVYRNIALNVRLLHESREWWECFSQKHSKQGQIWGGNCLNQTLDV